MTVEMFRDAIRVALDVPNTSAQLKDVWQEDDEDDILFLEQVNWDLSRSLLDGSAKAYFNITLRRREAHETIFEYEGLPLAQD
mgnify:CR=1 FL=1